MKIFCRLAVFIAFAISFASAQFVSETKALNVELFKDSASQELVKIDFSIPLTGVSDPEILFSHFAKRPLMIYYFSPKCVHCQKHFPEVQKMMKEYEPLGLTGIAVGLGGGIKKNDIRLFIDEYHASIPVFQDANSKFGSSYGTGYIPVLYLINPDGTFYRYESLTEPYMMHLKANLEKTFKK